MEKMETGRALAARLKERMALNGDSVSKLARGLGVSQGYLSQLLNGDRLFAAVGDDFIRRVAAYLGLPAMICFLLSGKFSIDDFVVASVEQERAFERVLKFVADSTYALEAGVDSVSLRSAPRPIQVLVVLLYQSATNAHLYPLDEGWSLLGHRG